MSGRMRGERNGRAKLAEDEVLCIRRLKQEGSTVSELARVFGVSRRLVRMIQRGERWAHLGSPLGLNSSRSLGGTPVGDSESGASD